VLAIFSAEFFDSFFSNLKNCILKNGVRRFSPLLRIKASSCPPRYPGLTQNTPVAFLADHEKDNKKLEFYQAPAHLLGATEKCERAYEFTPPRKGFYLQNFKMRKLKTKNSEVWTAQQIESDP
jgi:hypothetical protein